VSSQSSLLVHVSAVLCAAAVFSYVSVEYLFEATAAPVTGPLLLSSGARGFLIESSGYWSTHDFHAVAETLHPQAKLARRFDTTPIWAIHSNESPANASPEDWAVAREHGRALAGESLLKGSVFIDDNSVVFANRQYEIAGRLDPGNPFSAFSEVLILPFGTLVDSGDLALTGVYYYDGPNSAAAISRIREILQVQHDDALIQPLASGTSALSQGRSGRDIVLLMLFSLASVFVSMATVAALWLRGFRLEFAVRSMSGATDLMNSAVLLSRSLLAAGPAVIVLVAIVIGDRCRRDLAAGPVAAKLSVALIVLGVFAIVAAALHLRWLTTEPLASAIRKT
jgi:hypothetical protein